MSDQGTLWRRWTSRGSRRELGALILAALAVLLISASGTGAQAATVKADPQWGQIPLYFIANQGQSDSPVAYYVRGSDKTLYFTPQGVTFALTDLTSAGESSEGASRWIVKQDFVDANPVTPQGQTQTETLVSYFQGSADEWHTGLPTYSSICYPALWEGIDLLYSGTTDRLKHEFVVQPGADPAQILISYRGATVHLNEAGQLEVSTPAGGFVDEAPVAYQEVDGQLVPVSVAYELKDAATEASVAEETCQYGFTLGAYDPTLPLVIDPAVLVYCGFIGGSGNDVGNGIAVDAAGNAYVTGSTASPEDTFPVTVGPDLTFNGWHYDAFVAKVTADGTGLVYAGYIGGSDFDEGRGIAVDAAGNAYVTGYTYSPEATFPVSGGPDLTYNGGTYDAFVAKVSADGTGLAYAGYIGGSGRDFGLGVAVDASGSAYVTGFADSSEANFPASGGPDLTLNGGGDAFVAKVIIVDPTVYTSLRGVDRFDTAIKVSQAMFPGGPSRRLGRGPCSGVGELSRGPVRITSSCRLGRTGAA